MQMKVDWVIAALLSQVRLLERREGRSAVAVRCSVPSPRGAEVAEQMTIALPHVELEVIERDGRPKLLMVSFAMDNR